MNRVIEAPEFMEQAQAEEGYLLLFGT